MLSRRSFLLGAGAVVAAAPAYFVLESLSATVTDRKTFEKISD